ncbi:MAG: hypothetical protein ACQETB_02405 [Halobacteriota archaeon]
MTLRPGQATAPHAHERQEEVYVSMDGGQVRIDGSSVTVPPGAVVRIGPEPVRSIANDTAEERHTWVMFGAPPVGSIDDFGAYVVPEE